MKFRFEPNDTVMYGGQGACTLLEICEKDFCGAIKSYYVLRPAFSGSSVFYVPVDSETLTAKMRYLMSASEIREAIKRVTMPKWIDEDRPRQNYLKQVIDGGSTELLITAFIQLCTRQSEMAAVGKKMRASDERSFREIERLLLEELSYSFELGKNDVQPFLLGECDLCEK